MVAVYQGRLSVCGFVEAALDAALSLAAEFEVSPTANCQAPPFL